MKIPLRLLMVEDSEDDATLLLYVLRREDYDLTHELVATPAAMRAALEREEWDVITSDHSMPGFGATAALALAKELRPDVPFVIVSGEMDLNLAVSLMKDGAQDYVQKRELPRLVTTIERVLRNAEALRGRQEAADALEVSEMRYRRLFETAQDGILILDVETGQITDVNPFMIAMLGYSRDQFLGKKLWDIGVFVDTETSKSAFERLQQDGYVRYDDMPLEASDGQQVAVEFVSNVYSVGHTRVAQCNIRNITARKRADAAVHELNAELEQRVRERTDELEQLNRELETFNYSVSHDLRAPLRRVQGFTEALRDDYGDRASASSLLLFQNIRVQLERMNSLIDALLQLARVSRSAIKREHIDVSAMVERIADDLQRGDPDRRVDFKIADGVAAKSDEQLLLIVLENLLGNAWKFSAQRVPALIEFGAKPQPDGTTAYFVSDNGAGFDMAFSDRLFGPFQRMHSEKEFAGLGVGLATVQRIIHRHGGRVWAEAAVDKGAIFFFSVNGS